MDAATKLARQRLSVLELAEILGNVSEACRRRGISRSQFHEYKRRFQTHGLEGLEDLPPVPKSHPQTTPPEVVRRIVALALKHPAWCTAPEFLDALSRKFTQPPAWTSRPVAPRPGWHSHAAAAASAGCSAP